MRLTGFGVLYFQSVLHGSCTEHSLGLAADPGLVSVSAQDSIIALRRAHMCSALSLSCLPLVPWRWC